MPVDFDPEWARSRLEWWITNARQALDAGRSGLAKYSFTSESAQTAKLREQEDQTRAITTAVLGTPAPRLVTPVPSGHNFVELQAGIGHVQYALGRLITQEETRAHIRGSAAPAMSADALHPIVWGAAQNLWNDGHHSAAVQRAATFLNAHVQDLVSRTDISDRDLMGQAFSLGPPEPGRPRLRWPGADTDLTVKAMRGGILSFSQGVFGAIRNPATHSTEEIPKQVGLEQLATLSTLARWIDTCEVVRAG
ncbi:TIGR02391 family protein [Curtobacterium sp. USHLN213]|uniref:TIGR02391 family protein n=1 Tax=Curtobacterium sp. USHLN213 TaxID=3081255 RepID=UPI003016145A